MSPATLSPATVAMCGACEEPLNSALQCLNIECDRAITSATRAASRDTAKVAVGSVATEAQPRAFTSSGRVD